MIMSPYGGPHHAEVLYAGRLYLGAQWIADQGFAVVIADGHGTPGSPCWERDDAPRRRRAAPSRARCAGSRRRRRRSPRRSTSAGWAIRGWSFGGYLAALAVLQRPDVFHAAVAGAPPTDWPLYDTAYTERYLGLPDEQPEAYAATSPARRSPRGSSGPLLIIHGMADDNVVVGEHPAAVPRAPRGRPAAPGAAAVRGDAHDAAGGRHGEHPAPRAGLPHRALAAR